MSLYRVAALILLIPLSSGATAYYFQQENANLKNQIVNLNDEIARLRSQVSQPGQEASSLPAYLGCLSGPPLYHSHPHLSIILDGQQHVIPANIGIEVGCIRLIHTHATDGVLHVEPEEDRDLTLGDFFLIWGMPLNSTHVIDRGPGHVTLTVDGQQNARLNDYVLPRNAQPNGDPCNTPPCVNVSITVSFAS